MLYLVLWHGLRSITYFGHISLKKFPRSCEARGSTTVCIPTIVHPDVVLTRSFGHLHYCPSCTYTWCNTKAHFTTKPRRPRYLVWRCWNAHVLMHLLWLWLLYIPIAHRSSKVYCAHHSTSRFTARWWCQHSLEFLPHFTPALVSKCIWYIPYACVYFADLYNIYYIGRSR